MFERIHIQCEIIDRIKKLKRKMNWRKRRKNPQVNAIKNKKIKTQKDKK